MASHKAAGTEKLLWYPTELFDDISCICSFRRICPNLRTPFILHHCDVANIIAEVIHLPCFA